MSYLTEEQLTDFRRDGFIIIPSFYSTQEIKHVSSWIDELADRPHRPGRERVYLEDDLLHPGGRVLSRIEKFADFHEGLRDFIHAPKITGTVSEFFKEPAVLFKEKINFKLPGGGGFQPHQDIQPGWDDYASYFVSVLVTVDPSTVENGCLELAAGHHTRGLIGRKWEPLASDELRGIEFKSYPMEPGDAAFFDCFVPHRSKANLTNERRRNLYLTFNRLSEGDHREKYFSDKRKSYPPDAEREPGREYVFRV